MTAPALPPSSPAGERSAAASDATALDGSAPAKVGIKGWLVLTAVIGGPLAFGTFAALNETGAAMLSWLLGAYDRLTIATVIVSAILWIADTCRKQ